jgi:hypothetical protein
LDRHDSIDPLKDALGSSGINWSQYAAQANDHVRTTGGVTRKQFHRKATEAASKGPESLAKFFDDSGLVDLAKKVRAKKGERRNCGTGAGGFQKGNTCTSAKAAEAATGAVKGAITGATVAATYTEFHPPAIAAGAGIGAVAGGVKGLYDNAMRPTRVTKAIEKIGSSDEKITNIVKGLGGTPNSIASTQGRNVVTLDVRDDKNERVFGVAMSKTLMVVRPSRKTGRLTKDEIASIKKVSEENSSQHTAVIVEEKSPSYLSLLAKAGFAFAVSQAGTMLATLSCSACPVVVGTAIETMTGIELEALGKKR